VLPVEEGNVPIDALALYHEVQGELLQSNGALLQSVLSYTLASGAECPLPKADCRGHCWIRSLRLFIEESADIYAFPLRLLVKGAQINS